MSFADSSLFPICGGILFTLGLAGLVILAGWSWLWSSGPSKTQLYGRLRTFLEASTANEVSQSIKAMMEEVKGWKGGGQIAEAARATFLKNCKLALLKLPGDKQGAIDDYMSALTTLLDGLEGLVWLGLYLELVNALFTLGAPGSLKLIKGLAETAKLEKIVKLIEAIEKLDSVKDKAEKLKKMNELKQELEKIKGKVSVSSAGGSRFQPQIYPVTATGDFSQLTGGFREFFRAPIIVLRGCSPIVVFLLVSGVVGVCGLLYWIWDGGPWVSQDLDVDLIEIPSITVLPEPTIAPTLTFAPTPPPNPIDVILSSPWLSEEQKAQIFAAYLFDPEGDWIYSISAEQISMTRAQTDILGYVGVRLNLSQSKVDVLYNNSEYPCGEQIEAGFVVCTPSASPIPAGGVIMIVVKLGDDIPSADPDDFYTYAVVFDADGNPANNFQFQYPYDWDYFQGSDRWYQLNWNPDQQTWLLSVSDVVRQQFNAPSAARAVVLGDTLVFFIPAAELPAEMLGFRVSAFGHDGTYALEASSGDVSGADPTEPLTIISAEVIPIE